MRKFSSDVKKLGDKIVNLTLIQAKELADYLKTEHGIEPAAGSAVGDTSDCQYSGITADPLHVCRIPAPALRRCGRLFGGTLCWRGRSDCTHQQAHLLSRALL